jgi:glycosyltransferase involved in cell wall biosynthesis
MHSAAREALDLVSSQLGVAGRVWLTGYVSDDELIELYQATSLFVFPSLYEGFGLPVVEARACGAPVVAARSASLVELTDPRASFDPHRPGDIARTMSRVLRDDELRAELASTPVDARHTWPAVAREMSGVYDAVRQRSSRRRQRKRRQLAVMTPLPPAATGVADYSFRLLSHLAQQWRVHAFIDGEVRSAHPPDGVEVHSAGLFARVDAAVGGFDRLLYCFGNSEFHATMLGAIRRWPGCVLAHDIRLTDLYAYATSQRDDLNLPKFHEVVQTMYRDRIEPSIGVRGWIEREVSDRSGIVMCRDVIAKSSRFLVHSRYAANVARLDAEPRDVRKVGIVPFGAPERLAVTKPEREDGLVASFGHTAAIKNPGLIVEAVALAGARTGDVRLVFVGEVSCEIRKEIERAAVVAGVRDRVCVTGRVPRRSYEGWLRRATVAVQLRASSNGEMSASVVDCLAAGLPVVTTAIGAARELPSEAVRLVAREVSGEDLAIILRRLLKSPVERETLALEGRRWCAEHSMERAAEALTRELMMQATVMI